MIASETRLESPIPTYVSSCMRSIASGPCSGARSSGFLLRTAPISSTSWDDCQKKRYGLIVVPSMATTVVQNSHLYENVGIKNPLAASAHGTCTAMTVPKYARSANVSHLSHPTYFEYSMNTCSPAQRSAKAKMYKSLGPPIRS